MYILSPAELLCVFNKQWSDHVSEHGFRGKSEAGAGTPPLAPITCSELIWNNSLPLSIMGRYHTETFRESERMASHHHSDTTHPDQGPTYGKKFLR